MIKLALLLGAAGALLGCSPLNFSVDLAPGRHGYAQTPVLADRAAGRWKVAIIDLSGLIADVRRPGLLSSGSNMVDEVLAQFRLAEDDSDIKAVVLRVNSPGGTVVASDVLFSEIRLFQERTGKPVVASLGEIATSGGYYVALACAEIVAQESGITGSIGVILPTLNLSEGLARLGITSRAVVSGPNKALADPLSPPSEAHFAILQEMVDGMYAGFVARVHERRPALRHDISTLALDGRVMTGAQARDWGLVDSTGGVREAFARAKTLANLQTATLVKFHDAARPAQSAYASSASDPALATRPDFSLSLDLPGLGELQGGAYYLWSPALDR